MESLFRRVSLARPVAIASLGLAISLLPGSSTTPKFGTAPAATPVLQIQDALQPGDIIFRKGLEAVSHIVMGLDRASEYSHVGIVTGQPGGLHVVHAVPAEGTDEFDRVKREHLADFIRPDRAAAFAVYRLRDSKGEDRDRQIRLEVSRRAEAIAERQTPFDNQYDLGSDDRLYCTELVWKLYRDAGVLLPVRPRRVEMPFFSKEVLFPSALQHSPSLIKVCC